MTTGTSVDPGTAAELTDLVHQFAHLVDVEAGAGVAELFTEDGRFGFDDAETIGRQAIAETYARRAGNGLRTARHLMTNLRLRWAGEDLVSGTSIMLIFAADGPPPLPADPLLCADVDDEFRRVDGTWYLARRTYRTIFADPVRRALLPLSQNGKQT